MKAQLKRPFYDRQLAFLFEVNPVVAILGPRQCGKSTLARHYANTMRQKGQDVTVFDLESALDIERLNNPELALGTLKGLIIIDEIQKRADLFPTLRVLIDQHRDTQRYLILGSASRDLIQQSSETLAGRISYLELTPLQYSETEDAQQLWLRGGFPLSYLSVNHSHSYQWREDYVRTFLEQDIPALGFKISPIEFRRFWVMLAHYHGQTLNTSAIARSMNLSNATVNKYLDILAGTLMVRILQPWHSNLKKRQVKSPKIYFRDSGIYHTLLRIQDQQALLSVPQLGASWEGFALEETIRSLKPDVDAQDCYFWATQSGAELDLLVVLGTRKIGFEMKYQDAPKITKSMRIALDDLNLERLYIVYPGDQSFQMDEKIFLTNLRDLHTQ